MAAYALAEMHAPKGRPLISLAQNESLMPPSPRAIAAATKALSGAALYPDPECMDLRHSLAELHGIEAAHILCGSGSLDLIGCIARVYSGPNRAVLAPAHAYPFFRTAAQLAGARFDRAEEKNATVSVDTLLAAVQPDTGVVFLANPGNPSGTRISKSELQRLRRGLREDILLVIDEAYGEFADHLNEPSFDLVQDRRTIVLRTFSKAYSMAGFRIGWGLFPPNVAAELRKAMDPNNVSAVSQAAALAALGDQSYMVETCTRTAALRETMTQRLRENGFTILPSFANFVLIDLGNVDTARRVDAALRENGIFLRPQGGAGLPQALRMTIAGPEALDAAERHLLAWKRKEMT
jgi:histidinol-phosphate aminotransferase